MAQSDPQYAKVGAFALYQVLGGMIPFFDGVNGTISYTVVNIFSNGSMAVSLNGNVSEGNEVPTANVTYNFNDNIRVPGIFPAIDPSILTQSQFKYENITCSFAKNTSTTVPAGTYNTMEYTGPDANGTTTYFWFDPTTGLVIEMAAGGGVFQLQSSNIATPSSSPSGFATSVPFLETFGLAFGVGTLLFVGLWAYYNRKASKNAPAANRPNVSGPSIKGQKNGKKKVKP
ncbi:MAG: hypothetical protein ACYC7D_14545 [Nitrososphaerales archaeon]